MGGLLLSRVLRIGTQCGRLNWRSFSSTKLSSSNSDDRPPFNTDSSVIFTQPPSPSWKIGDGENKMLERSKNEPQKTWNLKDTPPKDVYRLLTSAIIPRPIAFVSSLSLNGIPNLAPFSYFSMVAHNPPLISISFSLSPRRPKDTRENILATKEFTVNIINEQFIEAANSTSVESPADVDEWLMSGLTMKESVSVKPPCVEESALSLECALYFSQDIPLNSAEPSNTFILGLIKQVHVRESILSEDGVTIDPRKFRAVSRLGGNTYARIGDAFDIPRPSWKSIQGDFYDMLEKQGKRSE